MNSPMTMPPNHPDVTATEDECANAVSTLGSWREVVRNLKAEKDAARHWRDVSGLTARQTAELEGAEDCRRPWADPDWRLRQARLCAADNLLGDQADARALAASLLAAADELDRLAVQ